MHQHSPHCYHSSPHNKLDNSANTLANLALHPVLSWSTTVLRASEKSASSQDGIHRAASSPGTVRCRLATAVWES